MEECWANIFIREEMERGCIFSIWVSIFENESRHLLTLIALSTDELSLLFTGKKLSKDEKERADHGDSAVQVVNEEDNDDSSIIPSVTLNALQSPSSTPVPSVNAVPLSTTEENNHEEVYDSAIETGESILDPQIHPNLLDPLFPLRSSPSLVSSGETDQNSEELLRHPLFDTVNLGIDRRLIVNRKRQLKMYRVWMQGIFRKV